MENQEKVRKIRSKPMRWMRFFRVKNGERVFRGKQSFRKLSFCTAFKHGETVGEQSFVLVNPFRRVKTAQRVKQIHHEVARDVGGCRLTVAEINGAETTVNHNPSPAKPLE